MRANRAVCRESSPWPADRSRRFSVPRPQSGPDSLRHPACRGRERGGERGALGDKSSLERREVLRDHQGTKSTKERQIEGVRGSPLVSVRGRWFPALRVVICTSVATVGNVPLLPGIARFHRLLTESARLRRALAGVRRSQANLPNSEREGLDTHLTGVLL